MKTNFKAIKTIPDHKHIYNEAYYHELISKSNVLPSLPSKEELAELLNIDEDFGYNLIVKLKNGKYAVYAGRTGCATCGSGEYIKHVRVFNSLDDFFEFSNIDSDDYSSLEELYRENYIVYSESVFSGFKNTKDIITAAGVLIFIYDLEKYVLDENDNLCIFKENIAITDSKTYILDGEEINIFDSISIRPFVENIRSENLIIDRWKFENITDTDEKSYIINYYINKLERSLNVEAKSINFSIERKESITSKIELLNNLK